MGKKKTVNLNGEPLRDAPFTEGVQITYKHNTIAQSADTVEYALETGGKAVEANIGVAYVKPEPETVTIPIYVSYDGGNETLLANCVGIAGTAYQYSEEIAQSADTVEVYWKGDTYQEIINDVVCVFNDPPDLHIGFFIPRGIPNGANRILINLS